MKKTQAQNSENKKREKKRKEKNLNGVLLNLLMLISPTFWNVGYRSIRVYCLCTCVLV